MKTAVSIAVVVGLLLAGLYAARPLLALRQLKQALESRDEDAVKALVDFATLRVAVVGHAHTKIEKVNDGRILSGARDFIEDRVADAKIESLATPDGLIHLVCDQREDGSIDTSAKPAGTPCYLKGKLAGFRYTSWTRFDALVQRAKGGNMTLTMGKDAGAGTQDTGVHGQWRLVDLIGS